MEQELVNIIDEFKWDDNDYIIDDVFIITEKDEEDLLESAGILIEELIKRDPMAYIHPTFHQNIVDEVVEMLGQMFDYDIYDEDDIADLEECILEAVNEAMRLFYKHVAPNRSFKTTFIRNKKKATQEMIEKIEVQLGYLKNIPQPEQRTPEWYAFRYKYLTASNIWKAFISQSTKNSLIYEKCKPLITESSSVSFTNTESPMHWGNKYEPVSVSIYETLYQTSISEFGCIPHKTISSLAASPDGINTLKASERYGRMLEVKNIVNRVIDGVPKMEYWIQMQLQLEVCDLKECDFLETRFIEYEDESSFRCDVVNGADMNLFISSEGKKKGIIMYFIKEGHPFYEYYTPSTEQTQTQSAFDKWEESIMDKNSAYMWVKNIYWKLDQLSCVLVLRNKMWFAYAMQDLNDIWSIIEKERIEGYEHRSPKKRVQSASSSSKKINNSELIEEFNSMQTKVCYINISNDTEL